MVNVAIDWYDWLWIGAYVIGAVDILLLTWIWKLLQRETLDVVAEARTISDAFQGNHIDRLEVKEDLFIERLTQSDEVVKEMSKVVLVDLPETISGIAQDVEKLVTAHEDEEDGDDNNAVILAEMSRNITSLCDGMEMVLAEIQLLE